MTFLTNLRERDKQPEIMDQPGLAVAAHQDALLGLSRINWMSGVAGTLWPAIRRLAEARRGQPLRVLDIATGGGDVPIRLSARSRRAGLPIHFTGIDISPTAIDYARNQAGMRGAADVEFVLLDAVHGPLPDGFDVVTSSLFLHHLDIEQAEDLLRRMAAAAGSLVLVSDLIRSPFGYLLAYLGTRVLSRSPVAHFDGPQSVRGAFTIAEARQIAERAGLTGAVVSWRWPSRYLLEWRRP